MEHESFEKEEIAQIMNDNFVCIKVDREERPDIDQVYMTAVQLMTGSGGWPLNCIALPDGKPVHGGTYFSKKDWLDMLQTLVQMKETNPDKMQEFAEQLTSGVQQAELIKKPENSEAISKEFINETVESWKNYWDTEEGGPNRAPKFPLPNNYQFLLEYAHLNQDDQVLNFVNTTLTKMALGGIYDQIGGGFSRYSVDDLWKVPHFEKMLYDNGQLVSLYSHAYAKTKNPEYKRVVEETLKFVKRELTNPKGGFYSALDADSEGEEGKFYVWKKDELEAILTLEEFKLVETYFNVNRTGHWEHGNHILLRKEKTDTELTTENQSTLEIAKQKMLDHRSKRIRPGLDDKILTSWNALMISGYIDAGVVLKNSDYIKTAKSQMNFLLQNLSTTEGALYHTHKNGKSTINGYLEDYAFLIEALIKLYEADGNENWLHEARDYAHYALDHYYDQQSGMFWFTSNLDAPLVAKKQEVSDNVIPASNSVMAVNLFKLGLVFQNMHFTEVSTEMLINMKPHIDYGQSYSNWLRLALYQQFPFYEIAVTGLNSKDLSSDLNTAYIPNKLIMQSESSSELPLLEEKFLGNGTIFVCVNKTCQLPVSSVPEALIQIK